MKEETTRTKPFVCLKPDDILKANNKSLTCGLEVELFVIKQDTGQLLKDSEVMEQILKLLPENITKDYYPYQLEIRTPPCRTASEMIKVFLNSLSDAYDVLHSLGYTLCPCSWHHNTNVFNGIHFHVRYRTNNFYNEMINVYPFILSIASHFRSCPEGLNTVSRRLRYSPHIGVPEFNPKAFMTFKGEIAESGDASRYKDMVFNGFTDNTRHRNKSVHTLETRCLDIPLKFNSFKLMIELLFAVFKSLDFANPIIADMGLRKYKNLSYDTRQEAFSSRHGKNYFFGMFNEDLIKLLTKKFKLNYVENPFLKNVSSGENFNPTKYNPINVFKVREPKVIKGIKIKKTKKTNAMEEVMNRTLRAVRYEGESSRNSIEHLEVGDNARLFRCEHCPNFENHTCMPETLGLGIQYEDEEDYDDEEECDDCEEEPSPRSRTWASRMTDSVEFTPMPTSATSITSRGGT